MLYGDGGEEEDRLNFLDKVFEMGCTFWDTAGKDPVLMMIIAGLDVRLLMGVV